jgi:hypothetical protein
MEALGGERRYSSYPFSTSALDRGEWSASRPGRAFIPGERTPGTHCTGGWVGPRAGLDTEARGTILCPRRESNPDRPDQFVFPLWKQLLLSVQCLSTTTFTHFTWCTKTPVSPNVCPSAHSIQLVPVFEQFCTSFSHISHTTKSQNPFWDSFTFAALHNSKKAIRLRSCYHCWYSQYCCRLSYTVLIINAHSFLE